MVMIRRVEGRPRRAAAVSVERLAARSEAARRKVPKFLAGLPSAGARYQPRREATIRLKVLIEEHRYQDGFARAIARVALQNVPELRDIVTLGQFFFYVDALVEWIPEIRHWTLDDQNVHERTVYLRIVQFYYYFNQPELEALQSPIKPAADEPLTPVSGWLRDFAVEWGAFLDTPESAACLESFRYAPEYGWQDYERAPEEYQTFNEFFARRFKNIDRMRPVARREDDRVVVFPAESTYAKQCTISTDAPGPLPQSPSIVVKHIEWPIHELLAGSEHSAAFEGGLFCHSFLNTYDYHRLHAPVAGRVIEAKFIPGQVYLKVDLKAQDPNEPASDDLGNAIVPSRYLDADDPTGYQFVQCRGLLVLDTPRLGKVAVLPMGMAQVSSVVFMGPGPDHAPIRLSEEERRGLGYGEQVRLLNERIKAGLVGHDLAKGEMFSFFQFGGSDCVMVFERKANLAVTATQGVHYPVRSQFALANFDD